jgi:transposase-like protein
MNYRNAETRALVVDELCKHLAKPLPVTTACQRVGISPTLYYRWQRWAREGQEEYIGIVRKLAAAQGKGEETQIDRMLAASEEGDVRATIWLLEHLWPRRYGRLAVSDVQTPLIEVDDPQEFDEAAEEEQRRRDAWIDPERVRKVAEIYRELGIMFDSRTGKLGAAPQPGSTAARPQQPQPVQDPLLPIMQAAYVALANGPRDSGELTALLCHTFKCQPPVVYEAYNRAGVEVLDAGSPGRKPRLQWPQNPQVRSRTIEKVVTPEAESSRDDNPARRSEAPVSQKESQSSWMGGEAGSGVGDYIGRQRG